MIITEGDLQDGLIVAARNSDEDRLLALLRGSADLQVTDMEGQTALHHAAWAGSRTAIEKLLAAGAEKDPCDNHGRTPLLTAAEAGRFDCVRLLLEQGADPATANNRGHDLLHHVLEWHVQTDEDCLYCLHYLLDSGVHEYPLEGEDGNNSVSHKVAVRDPRKLSILLDHGMATDAPDAEGELLLHQAVNQGQLDAARLLIARGADAMAIDCHGYTAMHHAVPTSPTLDFLMQMNRCPVPDNGAPDQVQEALSEAAACIDLLAASGHCVDSLSEDGFTALHLTTQRGVAMLFDHLLARGANPAIRGGDGQGASLLQLAVKGWKRGGSRAFLRHEQQLLNKIMGLQCTKSLDVLAAIEELYAPDMDMLGILFVEDGNAWTRGLVYDQEAPEPLFRDDSAPWQPGFRESKHFTLRRHALLAALLQCGIQADVVNQRADTLLHILCAGGAERTDLQLVLDSGIDGSCIGAVNSHARQTPLHLACLSGAQGCVRWLLAHGANKHAQDRWRHTPAHVAAYNKHPGCLMPLLEQDANIHMVDQYGCTPLHYALIRRTAECVELLLAAGADPAQGGFATAMTPLGVGQDLFAGEPVLRLLSGVRSTMLS